MYLYLGFYRSRPRGTERFFQLLTKTQFFCHFIEARSLSSINDAVLAFFDYCTEKVGWDTIKHLWWRFFVEVVNGSVSLAFFAQKLHHRCLIGSNSYNCHLGIGDFLLLPFYFCNECSERRCTFIWRLKKIANVKWLNTWKFLEVYSILYFNQSTQATHTLTLFWNSVVRPFTFHFVVK